MKIKSLFKKDKDSVNLEILTEKQMQLNDNIKQELAYDLCVDDIEPVMKGPDAGKYVIFNGEIIAQAILIAIRDKYNPNQKGFGKHYKIGTVSKIIRTARVSGASVLLGHN